MKEASQAAGISRRVIGSAIAGTLAAPQLQAAQAVTFGLTPVFLDSDIVLVRQIEAYLAGRLGRAVSVVKRRTYREVTSLLVAAQLDAAWICGYPFVQHREALEVLAVPAYRGAPLYQSYLIVRRDREATGLADLRGDIHAFSDPDSNSGFLVTRAALDSLGAILLGQYSLHDNRQSSGGLKPGYVIPIQGITYGGILIRASIWVLVLSAREGEFVAGVGIPDAQDGAVHCKDQGLHAQCLCPLNEL